MQSDNKPSTISKEILDLTEKNPKFKLAQMNQQDNTEFNYFLQLKSVISRSKRI